MYAFDGDRFLKPLKASSFKQAISEVEKLINSKLNRMKITAYFDGCCEPTNPGGNMGFGAVIYIDGVEKFNLSKYVKAHPKNTNNVAEYQAFGWVLKTIQELNVSNADIEIFGDSKLVVEQMNGKWKIKDGSYVQFAEKAKPIFRDLSENNEVNLKWIPRTENTVADELSKTPMLKAGVKFKLQKGQ